ncbi:MAG TPA: VWA domain-containing protein [Roseiflexaceae bacterium]|nr:VWA domain-containing protein [Roseiflexaceae bacterium]HMP39725.1 VWA domain-containing protein [Roseiflexaceae bacterium]
MLTITSQPAPLMLAARSEPQLGYLLLTISLTAQHGRRPINWALIADASRSMRIPIVDEQQFRQLVQSGGAREVLVDGIPVWQLTGPVPPEIRDHAPSALDYVRRALHTVVEQLGPDDRFALVAVADDAVVLAGSRPGDDRSDLARGIERLRELTLGENTDLARGLALGLEELRFGRDARRSDRILLLTDGFTQRPEACLELAALASAEGVTIGTIGLGGEFQEQLLTALADQSGGRALFLQKPAAIPRTVAAELNAARSGLARSARLRIRPAAAIRLRRVTRIRPDLAPLFDHTTDAGEPANLPLGDFAGGTPVHVLLEFLVPPATSGVITLAQVAVIADDSQAEKVLAAEVTAGLPLLDPQVHAAAAAASATRLQQRALAAAERGERSEAIRLLDAAATRYDELGETRLAQSAREQVQALRQTGRLSALATKELTYATRRLGTV